MHFRELGNLSSCFRIIVAGAAQAGSILCPEESGGYGCAADFGVGLACGVGEGDCCGADAGLTGAAGGMVMRGKPTTSFDGGLAGAGGALGLGEFGGVAVSAIGFRPSPVRQ